MRLRHAVGMRLTPIRFGTGLFTLFTLAVAPGLVPAAAADAIEARIERQGEYIAVNASVLMRVDARIAWEVLSDYDHLARFIPDMKTSRVVLRAGKSVLVEQMGAIGFLFYRQPVVLWLEEM